MALVKLHDAIEQLIQEVSERVEKGGVDVIGLATGFPQLDKTIGGLRRKAVYFLGGRPGMGKTSLALSMAMHAAQEDKKVLFLSLEMGADLLALRVLSSLTGIPSERIERGRLSLDEVKEIQKAKESSKFLAFDIFDENVVSEDFMNRTVSFQEKNGLDFLIVDYISLFRDAVQFGENERLARISNNMLQTAKLCDIPVLLLGQLNREVEKRENHVPVLSDIRDSGSIEQDAFCVMFAYRPYYYEMMFDGAEPMEVEKDAKIIIAKQRQGGVGQVTTWFYPSRTLWTPKDTVIQLPPPTNVGPLAAMVKKGRS